jgi:hypothetical protein
MGVPVTHQRLTAFNLNAISAVLVVEFSII